MTHMIHVWPTGPMACHSAFALDVAAAIVLARLFLATTCQVGMAQQGSALTMARC